MSGPTAALILSIVSKAFSLQKNIGAWNLAPPAVSKCFRPALTADCKAGIKSSTRTFAP